MSMETLEASIFRLMRILALTSAVVAFPNAVDLLDDSLKEAVEVDLNLSLNEKSLRSNGIAVASLSDSNGYLYYNFYSGKGCNETLTYTTGIASETCMTYQYYAPPDHYYYSFLSSLDFGSFQVKSLADGCSGTYIAYYTDENCQTLKTTATLQSLGAGQCKRYKNETYTNLNSFQALCSVTYTIPAPDNTYVVSSYNRTNCAGMAYTFNAYSNGACYGVYGVNSSFSYQCDGTSVLKDDYYSSLTCAASSSAMTINGGCTNAQFVSKPLPVAAVSTLVNCGYSNSESSKLSESQVVGIAMGMVFAMLVIVAVAAYFISGKMFAASRTVGGAFPSKGTDGTGSELSSTVSPMAAKEAAASS